jgi:hypothetical protein
MTCPLNSFAFTLQPITLHMYSVVAAKWQFAQFDATCHHVISLARQSPIAPRLIQRAIGVDDL